jgi:hypothetical protein
MFFLMQSINYTLFLFTCTSMFDSENFFFHFELTKTSFRLQFLSFAGGEKKYFGLFSSEENHLDIIHFI